MCLHRLISVSGMNTLVLCTQRIQPHATRTVMKYWSRSWESFAEKKLDHPSKGAKLETIYSHAPHNDVSVNDGQHIRWWSHNITL